MYIVFHNRQLILPMNRASIIFWTLLVSGCVSSNSSISTKNITRIVQTLADDKMQGRGNFQEGLEKSADFIASEYSKLNLDFLGDLKSYRQNFEILQIQPKELIVRINYKKVKTSACFFESKESELSFSNEKSLIRKIQKNEDFRKRIREIKEEAKTDRPTIVLVASTHHKIFERYKVRSTEKRTLLASIVPEPTLVFVLTTELSPNTVHIELKNDIQKKPSSNVVGVLTGKSRPDEYVIFSAHYDHLGIIESVNGDSIANGADDDASGVSAVISLASHFKNLDTHGRSLIFVAFSAEEIGGYGAQFFSKKLKPNEIKAMINFEMIGKFSKWGKNSVFITGFNESNLGKILQKNSPKEFHFYPDPYPTYNLFHRSDNAPFVRLGVPAHTISSAPIDKDKFYHSPDDEIETLQIDNLKIIIEAIAQSVRTLTSGMDTPTRIPLEE